jgi:putative Mg2+ transporter-C (MgtC) family protein
MLSSLNFLYMVPHTIAIRLLFASILGALIGVERDIHGRSAGLRTNLLISLGAAAFMILSETVSTSYLSGHDSNSILRSDPTRIAANIITGIGFIGAGAIIKSGFSVKGLTTAACIWLSAGIGMSAGTGYYELAIVLTAIGLFSLIFLNLFEKVYAKNSYRSLEIITSLDTNISEIIDTIKRKRVKIIYLDKVKDYETNKMKIFFTVRLYYKGITDKLSHVIVNDLEKSGFQLFKIKWWHQ